MVGPVGLEPTSFRLKGECSFHLCDDPKSGASGGHRTHDLSVKSRVLLPR